jgi:hypothetical protein
MVAMLVSVAVASSAEERARSNKHCAEHRPDGTRERVYGNCRCYEKPDTRSECCSRELRGRHPAASSGDADACDRSEDAADDAANPETDLPGGVPDDGAECSSEPTEKAANNEEEYCRQSPSLRQYLDAS